MAIGRAVQNGDPDFVAFSESDALPLAFGGQGGLHLNVHLRLPEHPAWQRPPWVSMATRRVADGSLVSRGFRNPELEPAPNAPGKWKTRSPLLNLMCPPPVGLEVIGQPMALTVEVYDIQDPDGPVLFQGSARYVPVCPEDSEPLCLDWCTPT